MSSNGFNILEHLDKLEDVVTNSTWILAKCPVCQGNLKISRNPHKLGAYACYSEGCHEGKNLIRKLLHKPSYNSESRIFKPLAKPPKPLVTLVKSIPITCEPKEFLTDIEFIAPVIVKNSKTITSYFDYGDFRVVRIDSRDSKKIVYPEYYSKTKGEYINGIPDNFSILPIYRINYLNQSNVVMVEGEKCATIAQAIGLNAITFPSFLYSDIYLPRYISKLKQLGVENILYLRDNDTEGLTKAKKVCGYFWLQGIGTKISNLVDIFENYQTVKGFDIADAYSNKLVNANNILSVLSKLYDY